MFMHSTKKGTELGAGATGTVALGIRRGRASCAAAVIMTTANRERMGCLERYFEIHCSFSGIPHPFIYPIPYKYNTYGLYG
jgi:hypothetical protein